LKARTQFSPDSPLVGNRVRTNGPAAEAT
jgi:hypothetical protein